MSLELVQKKHSKKMEEDNEDEPPKNMPRCKICGKPATRLVPSCRAWICDDCFTSTA